MEILNYYDVLSKEQVEAITNDINDYWVDYENRECRFAFGKYVDGICLIYINENQNGFNESKCCKSASFAIDKFGSIISIKNISGIDLYEYDSNKDLTLINYEFKRVLSVNCSGDISTDDFENWFNYGKLKLTNMIIYKIEYVKGLPNETKYSNCDEFGNVVDENGDVMLDDIIQVESGIFCKKHSESLAFLYKGDIPNFTNILIKSQFLLLHSKESDYFSYDKMMKADYPDYDIFGDSYIQKEFEDNFDESKYGVFDIKKKEIIIHCGECKWVQWHNNARAVHCFINGYINGFNRLEFKQSQIITYDKNDIIRGTGVAYSFEMTKSNGLYIVIVKTGDEIIREGENAGRNINWLKIEDKKTLIKYIQLKYIHIQDIEYFVENLSKRAKAKIWLANDTHYLFQNITKPSDVLNYNDCYRKDPNIYYEEWQCMALLRHRLESFEMVVGKDPTYLVRLILCGSLIVDLCVFEELRIIKANNIKYLKNLDDIEIAMRIRQDEIDEAEKMRLAEQKSREEQDELIYWENEGYKTAFDGISEAEWNND